MSITVECPCGKKLKARDEDSGKKAKCPACGAVVAIEELPVLVEAEAEQPVAFDAVSFSIGLLSFKNGHIAFSVHVMPSNEGMVNLWMSDSDNVDSGVFMNLGEFDEFLGAVEKTKQAVERLKDSGRIKKRRGW